VVARLCADFTGIGQVRRETRDAEQSRRVEVVILAADNLDVAMMKARTTR
jgi:hypothetical protein